jgi:hypothetical protein
MEPIDLAAFIDEEVFGGKTAAHYDPLTQKLIEQALENENELEETNAILAAEYKRCLTAEMLRHNLSEPTSSLVHTATMKSAMAVYLKRPTPTIAWMLEAGRYSLLARVLLMAGANGIYPRAV